MLNSLCPDCGHSLAAHNPTCLVFIGEGTACECSAPSLQTIPAYIPGELRCPQCNCFIRYTVIDGYTAEQQPALFTRIENCPNCNVPMQRLRYDEELAVARKLVSEESRHIEILGSLLIEWLTTPYFEEPLAYQHWVESFAPRVRVALESSGWQADMPDPDTDTQPPDPITYDPTFP